jgi:hypothetical protein
MYIDFPWPRNVRHNLLQLGSPLFVITSRGLAQQSLRILGGSLDLFQFGLAIDKHYLLKLMQFLITITLPFMASLVLAAICSVFWWKSFQNPWQFFVFALLLLLGLHRVVQVFSEAAKLLRNELGGYFLETRKGADFYGRIQEQLTVEVFVITGVVVIVGIPLLFSLRSALQRI